MGKGRETKPRSEHDATPSASFFENGGFERRNAGILRKTRGLVDAERDESHMKVAEAEWKENGNDGDCDRATEEPGIHVPFFGLEGEAAAGRMETFGSKRTRARAETFAGGNSSAGNSDPDRQNVGKRR